MNTPATTSSPANDAIHGILQWLALAHGREGCDDGDQVLAQFLLLRGAPVDPAQRLKLLDLLHGHCERVFLATVPLLEDISLPLPRKLRQRCRAAIDLLEVAAQDYLNTLAELFDPAGAASSPTPEAALRHAILALARQIQIHHLMASPCNVGLWQQLNATFRTSLRLGVDGKPGPRGSASIRRLYSDALLAAIAQPASFSSRELMFITEYIHRALPPIDFLPDAPLGTRSVFWVDLERDFPAHALIRRLPGSDSQIVYFSCEAAGRCAEEHRAALSRGSPAAALDLPEFADSHAGRGVLQRLARFWGHPTKRRFPRRRQSYRAQLAPGLAQLWAALRSPETPAGASTWMITNESPDGFALMHMDGRTDNIRVGDIVALRPEESSDELACRWLACIVRWAISENPEHIELGLQILAPRAIAAQIAVPGDLATGNVSALLLPAAPPLHPTQAIVLPAGTLSQPTSRLILVVEGDNLEVREIQTTYLEEQTGAIDVFSVLPEATE